MVIFLENMEKAIFIINGTGGAGKDTVCNMAAAICSTRNISSITPIVEIARFAGWDGVKTREARRLLSQLKEIFTEYNDLSFRYCMQQVGEFLAGEEQLMFIHVREPEEIERLKNAIGSHCHTLLVRRIGVSNIPVGNRSDDAVEDYHYDAVIENNSSLEDLQAQVEKFLRKFVNQP